MDHWKIYERTPRDAKIMLQDFGHLNSPENQPSYDSEVSKSCSLENWRNFESIISANSSFSKDRKWTLLRGVNPPEILEETHTGIPLISKFTMGQTVPTHLLASIATQNSLIKAPQ